MARRSGFRPQRGTKRTVSWGFGPGGSVLTALTGNGQSILGDGVVLAVEDKATIVRTRGNIEMIQTLGGAGEGFHVAFGIGIVSDQAFTVGATAIPGPISEPGWPGWFYHRFLDIHSVSSTIGDGVNSSAVVVREEVDSKAMRKISDGETMVAMIEVVEVGTASINVFFDCRILVKLT